MYRLIEPLAFDQDYGGEGGNGILFGVFMGGLFVGASAGVLIACVWRLASR
jgi:hypothetical protein